MPRVVLTPRAQEDLVDIWLYIAADDPRAADGVLDAIERTYLLLAKNPKLGPARPDIGREVRYLRSGRYLILYRVVEGTVEAVRIVHGARYLQNLL